MSYKSKYLKYKTKYLALRGGTRHRIPIINKPPFKWLDKIRNGSKTVEGRKYSEMYQNIKEGDTIEFFNRFDPPVICEVTRVTLYETFDEYIEKELHNAVPGIDSVEKAKELYSHFTDFKQLEKLRDRHGYAFMAIGVKPLKN